MSRKDLKTCVKCHRDKNMARDFYASNSAMFPDGRVPMCKACIKSELDENDVHSVKRILRQMDRPFIVSEWNRAVQSEKETLGWYLRTISSLAQYKDLTYEDSVGRDEDMLESHAQNSSQSYMNHEEIFDTPDRDVIRKWGTGYSNKEYYDLEKTWNDMITSNDISTPQHKTDLELYCQLKVLMKRALEMKDFKTFDTLSKTFDNVKKSSGFRPIDRLSGSESSGIRSFSQIFEEIERDGFIEPYPIEESQDIIDRTIQYMSNYTRKLLNMEQLVEPQVDTPKASDRNG